MTDQDAMSVVHETGAHFSIQSNLQATLSLTTLILATAAAIFVVPPMAAKIDYYHGHLRRKHAGWLGQPPRAPLLFAWGFVANVFLLLATVWYFYNESVNAASDDTAANYYLAVEALVMLVIAFKYLWKGVLWNLYDRTWAMVLAGLMAGIIPLADLVLIILMGIRNVWFSMAFMIAVFFIHVPLPFWTWVIYHFFAETPRHHKRKRESEM